MSRSSLCESMKQMKIKHYEKKLSKKTNFIPRKKNIFCSERKNKIKMDCAKNYFCTEQKHLLHCAKNIFCTEEKTTFAQNKKHHFSDCAKNIFCIEQQTTFTLHKNTYCGVDLSQVNTSSDVYNIMMGQSERRNRNSL